MSPIFIFFLSLGCSGEAVGIDSSVSTDERSQIISDCGGESCDLAAGEVCCMDGGSRSHCATDCDGAGFLECDGPEDCGEGDQCCGLSTSNECGSDCDLVVCHDERDCEGDPESPVCEESLWVENNYCKPD